MISRERDMTEPDGLRMPAEWETHARTWIAWPRRERLWGPHLTAAQEAYASFARTVARFEPVTLVFHPDDAVAVATYVHQHPNITLESIRIDDSWIRDTGPTFLVQGNNRLAATRWRFNGWGGKWLPYENDARLAETICAKRNLKAYPADLICEGGAIHTDGNGTLITTSAVILNGNRNPSLAQAQAEKLLMRFTGTSKVVWLPHGIVGDDTDGHVDNVACFIDTTTILAAHTDNPKDENYLPLHANLEALAASTTAAGHRADVVRLPLPNPVLDHGRRLTASYLNFYFVNDGVIVPVFDDPADEPVLDIFRQAFPKRTVVPFHSRSICIGGGGLHCIALNEPQGPDEPVSEESH